jgi:hypothetical protein
MAVSMLLTTVPVLSRFLYGPRFLRISRLSFEVASDFRPSTTFEDISVICSSKMDGETRLGEVSTDSTVSLGADEEGSDWDGPNCAEVEAEIGWNSEVNIWKDAG